jgi:hypothetical protein
VAVAAAESLISLRAYAAAVIAIAVAASAIFVKAPGVRVVRFKFAACSVAFLITLQAANSLGVPIGSQLLAIAEHQREAMAAGARTAFVPTATPLPTPSAPAGSTAIVSPPSTAPVDHPEPSTATVTPATAAPTTAAPATAVASSPFVGPAGTTDDGATDARETAPGRTLSYLPMGLFNAIFIPLPFVSPRFQDSAAGLEMIVWYLLLVAAAATLVREKSRWHSFIAPALSVAGLLLVFALVEGNAGTLFRHRGMVVPLVALLASPTIASILSAIHLRIRPVPGKP